jgi:orotate phosphoribosyltransferase
VDSRGAGAIPRLRALILAALRERLAEVPAPQAIAGLAKSGMTWGAWLSLQTGLPYATVLLDGPRSAGLQREVEGDIRGLRTVLVDNWVSSGASLLQAATIVVRNGGEIAGALVVAGRCEADLGFPVLGAFEVHALLNAAGQQGLISHPHHHHAHS